jgi:ABC-type multidrug transport system ATPase subunit
VAPKSNILIIDEPDKGLDPASARDFAKALKKLEGTTDQIFVMTHNIHFETELAEENQIRIEKRNGVSYVAEDGK